MSAILFSEMNADDEKSISNKCTLDVCTVMYNVM